MEETGTTVLRVTKETRLRLHRIKTPGQTYDELINLMADKMEGKL